MDVENLGTNAQEIITRVVENWASCDGRPPLTRLSLYVPADKSELWLIWAEGNWPDLKIRIRGVQRYTTGAQSKNSADLAITADATEDFVLGRADVVAVVSNDSDFCALFMKIREMSIERGFKRTPFVWVVSTGGGVLSPEVRGFVPDKFR